MRVVVQNLQKTGGLATRLIQEYDPDVLLAQEINLRTENSVLFAAHNVSTAGFGTAIGVQEGTTCTDVRQVNSPYAEFGGFIRKKTTVATVSVCKNEDDYVLVNSIRFVSFHGYNGQPFKDVSKLVAHVDAVLEVLESQDRATNCLVPVVFAGDFNTWTVAHLDAINSRLDDAGFHHVCSWPYPGKEHPLDHAFIRGMQLKSSLFYRNESDHGGAVLELFPI